MSLPNTKNFPLTKQQIRYFEFLCDNLSFDEVGVPQNVARSEVTTRTASDTQLSTTVNTCLPYGDDKSEFYPELAPLAIDPPDLL